MDACSPPNIGRNDNPPPDEPREGRKPQPTHDAYPVFRSQERPTESVKLGKLTLLPNAYINGWFTYTPATVWGGEWHAVLAGEPPPPLSRECPPKLPGGNESSPGGSDPMMGDNHEPQPTHYAYAINRSPGYPPEWVKLGPVTVLGYGQIIGRFTGAPISGWGWKWLAVPIGEEPPPLSAEPLPAKAAQPSRTGPEQPVETFQPLPGEEDDR